MTGEEDIQKEEENMIASHLEGLAIAMMAHIDVYGEVHLKHVQDLVQDHERSMQPEDEHDPGQDQGLDLPDQEQDHVQDHFLTPGHTLTHPEVSYTTELAFSNSIMFLSSFVILEYYWTLYDKHLKL